MAEIFVGVGGGHRHRLIQGCVLGLIVAMSISTWLGRSVLAQPARAVSEFDFNIPSQPLDQALEAFGAVTRLQVLYETSLTAGRHSTEVKGLYSQEAALRQLLAGTGLGVDFTEDHAFTLVPTATPGAIAQYGQFLGGIQSAVMVALCRRSETRPDTSRLAFQFFISGTGEIRNPHLLGSTGVASRDTAITSVLQHTTLRRPPIGMPQPVTMVLRAAGPGDGEECAKVRP